MSSSLKATKAADESKLHTTTLPLGGFGGGLKGIRHFVAIEYCLPWRARMEMNFWGFCRRHSRPMARAVHIICSSIRSSPPSWVMVYQNPHLSFHSSCGLLVVRSKTWCFSAAPKKLAMFPEGIPIKPSVSAALLPRDAGEGRATLACLGDPE